jgi:hypothetical protein
VGAGSLPSIVPPFERLAMRQKSVAMSLEDAIAAKLPRFVFTYDDGTQPFGFEGTFQAFR